MSKSTGMKYFIYFLLFNCGLTASLAQKKIIDSSVYGKWPGVGAFNISNDGKFLSFYVENRPVGVRTLFIQSSDNIFKREFPNVNGNTAVFSANSQFMVFLKGKDTLGIAKLNNPEMEMLPRVVSFKLSKGGTTEWLAYLTLNSTLTIKNLTTGRSISFDSVVNYLFSNDTKIFVITRDRSNYRNKNQSLICRSLINEKNDTIFGGNRIENIVFDSANGQMAFTASDILKGHEVKSIRYYRFSDGQSKMLISDLSPVFNSQFTIDRLFGFTRDGKAILFYQKDVEQKTMPLNDVSLDIWSYTDSKLQSQQLLELSRRERFLSMLSIDSVNVSRLELKNEHIMSSLQNINSSGVLLIDHKDGDGDASEWTWNDACLHSIYLIDIKTGKRLFSKGPSKTEIYAALSPDEKFMVFFDPSKKSYYSYEIASSRVRNITEGVNVSWNGYYNSDLPTARFFPKGIALWVADGNNVLIYDRNDIWKSNLRGGCLPVNITNGYGRKHSIIFRIGYNLSDDQKQERLILNAYNVRTKENGFFVKHSFTDKADPEMLSMDPYIYYIPDFYKGWSPLKARDRNVFLVKRMSASKSPNLYRTEDFKSFTELTDFFPEKDYLWITSELISWRSNDGSQMQGILYKPENFDPRIKYPVIFNYYGKESDALHEYLIPDVNTCTINIPYFVSNGYLVFKPDILYKTGQIGPSVMNSISSAARYLTRFPWIDSRRMGIQGHSFGGYETDYIISHTHIFTAAMSACGISDLISDYGSLWGEGTSKYGWAEKGQGRMNGTLWQTPDLYIMNSPIFKANQVTTPLLMMNNKKDEAVSFSQGVEFFIALRRLKKKVWMLQYDDGAHWVSGSSANDLTIRVAQFFDHYLKGAPLPKWMTEGIPARMKRIDTGLELNK